MRKTKTWVEFQFNDKNAFVMKIQFTSEFSDKTIT